MTEAEWLSATKPKPMFSLVMGRRNARKLRLFAVACCRRIPQVGDSEEIQKALAVAELFADGLTTKPHRRNAENSALSGPPPLHIIAHALSKVAFEAASRASWYGAGRVAFIATEHMQNDLARIPFSQRGWAISVEREKERVVQTILFRDIFGNPFRSIAFSSEWRTDTVISLGRQMYESRDFSAMPILADALQDAGCDNEDILNHCRSEGIHVRGCWVVDTLLGKS